MGRNAITAFVTFLMRTPFIFPWGHKTRTYRLLAVDAVTRQAAPLSIELIPANDHTDLDDPFLVDSQTIHDPNEIVATINVDAKLTLKCKGYENQSVSLNAGTPNPAIIALVRSPTTTQSSAEER
jgi:hypothetical protein